MTHLIKNEIEVTYYSNMQIIILGILIIFIVGLVISMLIICKKQQNNYNHSNKKYNVVEIKEMDEIFLNKRENVEETCRVTNIK